MKLKRLEIPLPVKRSDVSYGAIDPFFREGELVAHTAASIDTVAKCSNAEIFPVYALNVGFIRGLAGKDSDAQAERFENLAEEMLKTEVAKVQSPRLAEPFLLRVAFPSLRTAVQQLVDFSKQADADLIVAGTHCREGLIRTLSGSFAETLMILADVPVLIISPNSKTLAKVETILFPTDFSENGQDAFDRTLDFAAAFKAKIILFNQVERATWGFPSILPLTPYPNPYDLSSQFSAEVTKRKEEAEKLAQSASSRGVQLEIVFNEEEKSVVDSILELSLKRGVDLVAMVSQTGPVASTLLGSFTSPGGPTLGSSGASVPPAKMTKVRVLISIGGSILSSCRAFGLMGGRAEASPTCPK